MTDLTSMRDRPVGTPGIGFSPKRAKGTEEGLPRARKALAEYFHPRSMWARFSGEPTPEQAQSMGLFETWAEGKTPLEIAKGLDQFDVPVMKEPIDPVGAILPARALKELRKLQKLKTLHRLQTGWNKRAAGVMHRMDLADIKEAVNAIPKRLWDRIRSIRKLKGDPREARAAHTTAGTLTPGIDEADVWFHPETWEPQDILHEVVGHEGSMVVKEVTQNIPNLRHFRNWWDNIHTEMNLLQKWLRRHGGSEAVVERVYLNSPDEIFSRYVEGTMYRQGDTAFGSMMGGVAEAYARRNETLAAFREGLEEAQKVQRRLGGDPGDLEGVMDVYTNIDEFKYKKPVRLPELKGALGREKLERELGDVLWEKGYPKEAIANVQSTMQHATVEELRATIEIYKRGLKR